MRDRLELTSKFNDIFKNYLIGIVKLTNGQNQIYIRKIFVSRFFCNQLYVFLPLIEILTKIINHTNKETVYNPLTGKKPVIFARWVSLNIWLRLFNITP
jgi:hypothetical protein